MCSAICRRRRTMWRRAFAIWPLPTRSAHCFCGERPATIFWKFSTIFHSKKLTYVNCHALRISSKRASRRILIRIGSIQTMGVVVEPGSVEMEERLIDLDNMISSEDCGYLDICQRPNSQNIERRNGSDQSVGSTAFIRDIRDF